MAHDMLLTKKLFTWLLLMANWPKPRDMWFRFNMINALISCYGKIYGISYLENSVQSLFIVIRMSTENVYSLVFFHDQITDRKKTTDSEKVTNSVRYSLRKNDLN